MSKVYGYCRTARAGNMEEQIELVSNYCKTKGMCLEKIFCDDGVSANKIDRDEMSKLFDVLEDGDVIVTKDFSRFTRNPIAQQMLIDDLDSRDIQILYVDAEDTEDGDSAIRAWFEQRWEK